MKNEHMNFISKIEEFSAKNALFEEGDSILVCLSGGADSVCLLRVALELRGELGLTIRAAHVNHMLRGADADADEAFCRGLCLSLGVELFVERIDVAQLARDTRQGTEAAARSARYDYFFRLKNEHKIDKIATAHNQNDNAETSLMFFLRGSGIDGLKGICAHRADGVIRPLLCAGRADIERYLSDIGQGFVTDITNTKNDYTRNRIRNVLLPQLAVQFNPNIVQTAAKNAMALSLDAQCLDRLAAELADKLIQRDGEDIVISVPDYTAADKALALRALRRAARITAEEDDISFDAVLRCDGLFGDNCQSKTADIALGVRARREYSTVRIYKRGKEENGFCYPLFIGEKLYVKEADISVLCTVETKKNIEYRQKNCEYFDYNFSGGQIYIRSRKNGDKFFPFGMKGKKKLKDYFIDEKIPVSARGAVPLIVCGDEILWVCGRRRSGLYQVGNNTENILKIVFWEGR